MTIATLKLEVAKRISNSKLVQLTNEAAGTSVNDTVLTAACSDAIGEFQLRSGMLEDSTNLAQIPILVSGVIYYLEHYKSRDGNIMSMHGKKFFGGCLEIRDRLYISPISNSEFTDVVSPTPPISDMNKFRRVFSGATPVNPLQEVNTGVC